MPGILAVITGERGWREIVRPLRAAGVEPAVLDWEELRGRGGNPHARFPFELDRLAASTPDLKWIVTDMSSAFLVLVIAEAVERRCRVALRLRGDLFSEAVDQMRLLCRGRAWGKLAATALSHGLNRVAFREPDLFLPVSGWLAEKLQPPGPVRVVSIPCEVSQWQPAHHEPRAELRVVSVTNFDYEAKTAPLAAFLTRQGPRLLREGIRVDVAGSGTGLQAFRERVGDVANCLGKASVGPDFYAGYDALLHLSGLDALPYVVFEAQASALPVIASNACGMTEQIADGVTGYLVPPEDDEAVVGRLLELRRSAALRSSIGVAARNEVSGHLTHEAVGGQLRQSLML